MVDDNDALFELSNVSDVNRPHAIRHYLYFPSETDGKRVASDLRQAGFEVEDELGADEENWLVLVHTTVIPTPEGISNLRQRFEKLAEEYDGEYDGWEAAIPGE